jgi:DNA-binding CsgD family transcriptional regulator
LPQSLKQPQLKSTELVILKSLALGLGCDTIKNLLDFSDEDFEKKLNSLYTKLQVRNAFTAVGVVFKLYARHKQHSLNKYSVVV